MVGEIIYPQRLEFSENFSNLVILISIYCTLSRRSQFRDKLIFTYRLTEIDFDNQVFKPYKIYLVKVVKISMFRNVCTLGKKYLPVFEKNILGNHFVVKLWKIKNFIFVYRDMGM